MKKFVVIFRSVKNITVKRSKRNPFGERNAVNYDCEKYKLKGNPLCIDGLLK